MTKALRTLKSLAVMAPVAVFAIGLSVGTAMAMAGDSGGSGGSGGSSGDSGGSSGGSSNSGSSSGTRVVCPPGFTVSANKKKCLRNRSGLQQELPAVGWGDLDDNFLNAAVLAHGGQYNDAIVAFEALERPNDPYVLTYLGYSHRKLGNVDLALGYYDQALEIRPDYVRARQYLGEGYLAMDRLDDAKGQLQEIAQRCGTDCEPYVVLDKQITDYLKSI